MGVPEPPPDVRAFFQSYCVAFEQRDAASIAEHFAYPAHMASDMGRIMLGAIPDKAYWTAKIEQLLGMYRAIDVASARVLHLTMLEITPHLVQPHVHWALDDSRGALLYDFLATYTLVTIEDSLRIVTIAHNEIPQYRACVARFRTLRSAGTS